MVFKNYIFDTNSSQLFKQDQSKKISLGMGKMLNLVYIEQSENKVNIKAV